MAETDQGSKRRVGAELGGRSEKVGMVSGLGALRPSLFSEEPAAETVLSLGLASVKPLWRSKGCE